MRIAINPCHKCGACCAAYRVSFYWVEADPNQGGIVPPEMTEALPPHLVCMRGTNQHQPRCVALRGRIGDQVSCSIYNLRSSTCREFGFHDEDGYLTILPQDLERCNQARKAWGLEPLQLKQIIRGLSLHRPGLQNHLHRSPLR